MKKKILLCLIGLVFVCGCSPKTITPMNVCFKNQTLPFSPNHCITVVYAEDKRIRDKSTDVLIWSDTKNLMLDFVKERGKTFEVLVPEKNQWFSLTNLFDESLSFATFATAETTTYIITSNVAATIKLKAVGGDAVYHLDTGFSSLENIFDVSKELEVKLQQSPKMLEN